MDREPTLPLILLFTLCVALGVGFFFTALEQVDLRNRLEVLEQREEIVDN